MSDLSRRKFIQKSVIGLAAFGTGLGGLTLNANAQPTQSSGDEGSYGDYLKEKNTRNKNGKPQKWAVTAENILGPFHRPSAPFRGKISPPLVKGKTVLIKGRVWAFDIKKPLAGATLDVWQASAAGRYDNDDRRNPPKKNVFLYRSRLTTDENGYYEYETIYPGQYEIGRDTWRPAHIHYWIKAIGYTSLITQLYFEGDPYNQTDRFIDKSLIIPLKEEKAPTGKYQFGVFDIVLAKKT